MWNKECLLCLQLFSLKQAQSFLKRKVFIWENNSFTKDKGLLKESENLQVRFGLCIERKVRKLQTGVYNYVQFIAQK